jgi:hydrogenase-4 transcriptional activator
MLILDVWREACRHTDIADAAERIAAVLPPELPPATLLVRRLEIDRCRLDTVAVGTSSGGDPLPPSRTELSPRRMAELLTWCRAGRIARHRADALPPPVDAAVPGGLRGDVLVGPLLDDDGEPVGVAVLVSRVFGAVHENTAQRLLEPLSVALTNDARLHELLRLREALEADRTALLSRLGRADIADALVGSETGLRAVMDRVRQVAPAEVPVLLLGETGTGKEVIAREIHRLSGRAAGPVVRVNCGAIPPGLIDSELFGHERGSFTGATQDRAGWFERADGGTLFLDEIGELPLDAQVRLLRVLQDGTFERVGGRRTLRVDVRIVAATHRDPLVMVQEGRFREDLWYRVGVFPIRLPPLRERLSDIPALAAHFAAAAGVRVAGAPLAPTPEDVALLSTYRWPGNVRELAAVIERAAILGNGRRLEVAAALGTPTPSAEESPPAALPPASAPIPVIPLDAAMMRHIEEALRATRGRVEGEHGAAALLGVNPHTLRSRMRKLGIQWGRYRGAAVPG